MYWILGLVAVAVAVLFYYERKEKPIVIYHPSRKNHKIIQKVSAVHQFAAPLIHTCNGVLSTLVAEHLRWYPDHTFVREKVETPDEGFVNVLWLEKKPDHDDDSPLIVFFPGVSLDTRPPPYAYNMMIQAQKNKWNCAIVHWRGTIEKVKTPKFYSIHDTHDVGFSLEYISKHCSKSPIITIGCSLGSSLLVKYLGETGKDIPKQIVAAISVSNPYHVPSIHEWFKTSILGAFYHKNYLSGMKALLKRNEEPILKSEWKERYEQALMSKDIWEFDKHLTLHLDTSHNCSCLEDYYHNSSSENYIDKLEVPTLFVSAGDDPVGFLRKPELFSSHKNTILVHTQRGGHLSWIRSLKGPSWLDDLVREFIEAILEHRHDEDDDE